MNKRNVIKRALALFLILALSSGTAFAQDDAENPGAVSDKGGESASAEGSAAPSEEDGTQEKEDDTQGESGEEYKKEQPEKEIRIIKVEEEYTYICGDIFSLNAELMDEEEFLREESLKEEAREDGESPEEEETSEEGKTSGDEKAPEEKNPEESDPEEEIPEEEIPEGKDIPEGEKAAEEEEGLKEDVLQYESMNPEVAVIDKAESGEARVKAVGAGDAVIKITAPETKEYARAEAEAVVHVLEADTSGGDEVNVLESRSMLPGPAFTKIENVSGGISLAWEKIGGASGYRLERSITGAAPWNTVKTSKSEGDVTYTDRQVTPGGSYYYRVRAYDSAGNPGLTGGSRKRIYLVAPSLSVSHASTGNQLRWNRPAGAGGYYVYRKEAAGSAWKNVAVLTQPGEVGWRDASAGNGKTYIYSVRAYKGSSFSAYSAEKSYVRVSAPSVKSWKRKSSTQYKLTWSRNSSATGYQIQYAQNGMFVGAKKATVKSGKTTSYTVKKLQKKKSYHARIRAYKVVGKTTYYSDWSAAKTVKSTRTTKATLLKKKKKTFEIRAWAGQKMYQYDTLQGSCTDGTYAYYLLNNRKAGKCKVVKVKRSSLKVVMVSGALDVAHGNDMTYDANRKRLVIVHSTGADPKRLTSVNPNTLTVTESKHVQIPKKLPGGSLADAAGATAFSGIAYSKGRKQYAVLLSHNYNFVILDSNLDPVQYVKASKKYNYVMQGIDATDDYIMVAQSPKTSKQKYNIITVYDWDGRYISKINVKKGYEIESIYHVGSKYYAGFYRSYYKTTYKNVVKEVKVKGKIKKKKVKVKQRKLQRDNYVYQLSGI